MEKILSKNRYPIYKKVILKLSTHRKNIEDIVTFLENQIKNDDLATYITTYNHYQDLKAKKSLIIDDIVEAKNIIFCFGSKLPNVEISAIRPRSFGIVETKDSFVISFLEAPGENGNKKMKKWVEQV